MCEYFSENAMPWLIGMSYKAIRTKRHKYIHWTQKSLDGVECDELYDLKNDPYEMQNLIGKRGDGATVARLRKQLAELVAQSVGLWMKSDEETRPRCAALVAAVRPRRAGAALAEPSRSA